MTQASIRYLSMERVFSETVMARQKTLNLVDNVVTSEAVNGICS